MIKFTKEEEQEKALDRYEEILAQLLNIAIKRFDWEGLPIGLTSEILETNLIYKGQVIAFKREEGALTILPCMGTNQINVYGQFDTFEVIGDNGFTTKVKADEGVRILNNPLGRDDITTLDIYSQRINAVEKTQDVNLFQQNIPKLILTDENGKLTVKNLMSHLMKYKFFIFGRKGLASQLNTTEVLDTSSPYLLDKLQTHKKALMDEVLSYLAINNANTEKKERLIVDEVNANNEYVDNMLDLMYDLRLRACKEINEMFDVKMSVKKREVRTDEQIHPNDSGSNRE